MLSMDLRRLSLSSAFWSGAAQAFDMFGLRSEHLLTDPAAAAKADRQALADDWKAVSGDLAAAWRMLKPELDAERARAR